VELWCLLPRGWALAEQGEATKGISDIREGMERRRAHGIGAVWPWFFALLAELCGMCGRLDEGLRALQDALQWVERNDEHLYEAEVYPDQG
jgi:hypothetical protein